MSTIDEHLTRVVSDKNMRIADLERGLCDTKTALTIANSIVDKHEAKIMLMKAQVDAGKRAISELQREIGTLKAQKKALRRRVRKLGSVVTRYALRDVRVDSFVSVINDMIRRGRASTSVPSDLVIGWADRLNDCHGAEYE